MFSLIPTFCLYLPQKSRVLKWNLDTSNDGEKESNDSSETPDIYTNVNNHDLGHIVSGTEKVHAIKLSFKVSASLRNQQS